MNRLGKPHLKARRRSGERLSRWLVPTLALLCFTFSKAAVLGLRAVEPQSQPDRRPMEKVFETQRPMNHDLLVLTTGEQISGTILNQSFNFHTAYAELQFQRKAIAGMDLGSVPGGSVALITVNDNHLAGFLKDPSISFKSGSGEAQQIRREKVAKIILRVGNDELSGIPEGSWISLKNGDRISGQLLMETLPLRTTVATTNPKVSDLLQLSNTNAPEPALLVLRDGQNLRGTLALEDLLVQLDIGQKVSLYREHVAFIATTGATSNELAVSAPRPAYPLPVGPTNIEGMVWIPAGEFVMGSPKEELGRDTDEGPQTKVTFTRGFWLGKCEVTQAEYQRVMGSNPSTSAIEPIRPVEKVSWFEALEYCRRLMKLAEKDPSLPTNYIYRLPTEAEWEYACRAGTTTRFNYGEDNSGTELAEFAWFTRNSESTTHPVGAKKPNRWGLHDMHGNVWEWCLDRWEDGLPVGSITNNPLAAQGTLRVARGGSWLYEPKACRSANRDDYSPWDKCSDIGFRVVLAPLPDE